MASQNERARWERAWDQVTARMDRQKYIITRLVGLLTEARAALEEIAAMDAYDDRQGERAQLALDRMDQSAAAEAVRQVDSIEKETPVEDPRRKR